MKCKQLLALLLCVLTFTMLTACTGAPTADDPSGTAPSTNGTLPTHVAVPTVPAPEPTPESVFIGSWSVEAETSIIRNMVFNEKGEVNASIEGDKTHTLGGTFSDDGTTITIKISDSSIVGPYTVEGDTITINGETETLVLTKN